VVRTNGKAVYPARTQTAFSAVRGMGVPTCAATAGARDRHDQCSPTNLNEYQRDLLMELGKTLDKEVVPNAKGASSTGA